MGAQLTYYIFEGELTGTANNRMWNLSALSGGGGGSTRNPTDGNANNPYATGVKTEGEGRQHRHGGPIPVGRYRIAAPSRHPHLGLSARLHPYDADQTAAMMGRDGFYIHGRAPHGSDGCIVPMEQFQELMAALGRERGGVLYVLEAMGGTRFA